MALAKLLSQFADYLCHVGVLAASLPFAIMACSLKGIIVSPAGVRMQS